MVAKGDVRAFGYGEWTRWSGKLEVEREKGGLGYELMCSHGDREFTCVVSRMGKKVLVRNVEVRIKHGFQYTFS